MTRTQQNVRAGIFVTFAIAAAMLAGEVRADEVGEAGNSGGDGTVISIGTGLGSGGASAGTEVQGTRGVGYIVAEKMTSGGFAAPSAANSRGVQILSSGMVMVVRGKSARLIAQLMPFQMIQLQAQIDAIRETELIDTNSRRPSCTDAPETVYSVRAEEKSPEFKIAANLNCHQFTLKNYDGLLIKVFLDQLDELASAGTTF